MNKRFAFCALFVLLAALTASCSPFTGTPPENQPEALQPSSENLISPNAQPATASALEVPPPIAQPPSYDSRPLKPGETQKTTMPNGLPALQPKGVNVDDIFAENITDTNRRFERLENAVIVLRQEFESFKPAIVRLVAVESDIQDLIKQLDMLLRNEPAAAPPTPLAAHSQERPPDTASEPAAPPPPEPAAATTPKVAPTPQPPAPAGDEGLAVKALRTGTHSDKLRLVLDASGKTPFSVDLDNQENLLIIELPEADWDAARQKRYEGSSLIQSYSVESIHDGRGSRVILTLRRPTKLLKQQALPPGENPNYRIFLDLEL